MKTNLSRKRKRKQSRQGLVREVVFSTAVPEFHPGGTLETIRGKLRLRLADTGKSSPDGFITTRKWINLQPGDEEFYPHI